VGSFSINLAPLIKNSPLDMYFKIHHDEKRNSAEIYREVIATISKINFDDQSNKEHVVFPSYNLEG